MTIVPDALEPTSYGPATETLRGLLRAIEGFQWFTVHVDHSDRARAVQLVGEHLAQLRALGLAVTVSVAESTWLEGPLEVFDRAVRGRYDPEIWGDPWLHDEPWGAALGAASARVRERVEQSFELLARIRPPLWPKAGFMDIAQTLLVDPPLPSELRPEPRWAMLGHVESNLWRLFDWAVAFDGTVSDSPFHSLFQLHLLGYYPLGIDDGKLLVFGRGRQVAA